MKLRKSLIGLIAILAATFISGYYIGRVYATSSNFYGHAAVEKELNYLQSRINKLEHDTQTVKLPEFYSWDQQPAVGEQYSVPVTR